MAKGYAMERWQGKKGSNVFYKIKNSSNAQKQGVRERVYEVSNPKTRSQALQRMKVRAAQNFYNTLAPILNRAMQGVKYGGMTRNEFMKYALSMSSSPAVEKGSSVAIPGNYLLSKGSLPRFSVVSFESTQITIAAPWAMNIALNSGMIFNANSLTQITSNGAIHESDQITFVLGNGNNFYYKSFVVQIGTEIPYIGDIIYLNGDGTIVVQTENSSIDSIAVILSRKNGNKYERSTSYLTLNENSTFIQQAYSTQAINAALDTYQKSVSVNGESTDWPVEPEADGLGGLTASISAPYILSDLDGSRAQFNGRKVLVFQNINTGELTEVGTLGGYIVDFATHQTLAYMQSGTITALVPTDVPALASLPTREINAGI